jgi:hypothetical protein
MDMRDADIITLSDKAAVLMRTRLGARGETLGETLRSRGRALPRKVRKAAQALVMAQDLARHPTLRQRIDRPATTRAGREVLGYLEPLGAAQRRWRLVLSILGSAAFGLLATLAGLVAVLRWRGYL